MTDMESAFLSVLEGALESPEETALDLLESTTIPGMDWPVIVRGHFSAAEVRRIAELYGKLAARLKGKRDQYSAEIERIYQELSEVTRDIGSLPEFEKSPTGEIRGKIIGPSLIRLLTENVPEPMMQMLYPRRYKDLGQYHSPKTLALYLGEAIMGTISLSLERSPASYRIQLPLIDYMAKRRFPLFFLDRSLLDAIKMTDFADDINWFDMPLPYEHGIIVMPRGGFAHPEDGDCGYLLWSRVRNGDQYPSVWKGIPRLNIGMGSFSIVAICPNTGRWYDSSFSEAKRKTVRLRNLFYREGKEACPVHQDPGLFQDPLSDKDAGFLEEIGVILFGTLMAMNARPGLVQRERVEKVVPARKDRPRMEFWQPNVIGQRYKMRREVPSIMGREFQLPQHEKGTHASPRLHWRRGFFRQQPFGPGRRERRTIWLEPTLIGAGNSAAQDESATA